MSMSHQPISHPAAIQEPFTGPPGTGEVFEAAFSVTGPRPQCGVAITHSIAHARERLADMLTFCGPG